MSRSSPPGLKDGQRAEHARAVSFFAPRKLVDALKSAPRPEPKINEAKK